MINIDLNGKKGIVFGVANHRSIAWAISQKLLDAGADVTIAYQNERFKSGVEKLIDGYSNASLEECDVSREILSIIRWLGIVFILGGNFSKTIK